MKKVFKKLSSLFLVVVLVVGLFSISVAAAGSSTIAFSNSKPKIGDAFTVTVKFSAPETMLVAEGVLNYDSKILKFESVENENGKLKAEGTVNLFTEKTATIKFTCIAAGTSTISVSGATYSAEATDGNPINGCSANVTVVDKKASQSSNANLKSLWISAGTLSPAFSPNTTSYKIQIPNDKTVLTVSANPEDSAATVTVSGSKNMKVGQNKRVIKVTAGNGTVKEYVLNISRLDENGKEVAGQGEEKPEEFKVVVDGNPMIIADNFPTENLPAGFTVAAYKYKEKDVSSITDGSKTLLYLTDEAGENGSFYEINAEGEFVKFIYVQNAVNTYIILTPESDQIPTGYTPIETTIGSVTVTAYRNETESLTDFVLIYAKGLENYTGWYRFDTVEKTFQRAEGLGLQYGPEDTEPQTLLEKLSNFSDNEKIAAITIATIILLLIAALVVLIVKVATAGKAKKEEEDFDDDDYDEFETITITSRDE